MVCELDNEDINPEAEPLEELCVAAKLGIAFAIFLISDGSFEQTAPGEANRSIPETEIEELEQWMDAFDEKLEPLQYFILPGGGKAATFLHAARTICRRAERSLVFLNESEEVRPELIKYLKPR